MSLYMSRLFPRSNSSFLLRGGNALQSKVVRLREETYLIDSGVGAPRTCTQNELINVPKKPGPARFHNRVGFLSPTGGESPIKMQMLERCFVDLMTGDPRMKERAAARFNDMVGQNDAVEGEEKLLLPRKFRKHRAWMELNNVFRRHGKVKGFWAEKVKGGYSVGIAGYLAFLPNYTIVHKNWRVLNDRFHIVSMNPRSMNIVVGRSS